MVHKTFKKFYKINFQPFSWCPKPLSMLKCDHLSANFLTPMESSWFSQWRRERTQRLCGKEPSVLPAWRCGNINAMFYMKYDQNQIVFEGFFTTGGSFHKGSGLLPAPHSQAVLVGFQIVANSNRGDQRLTVLPRQLRALQPDKDKEGQRRRRWSGCFISEETSTASHLRLNVSRWCSRLTSSAWRHLTWGVLRLPREETGRDSPLRSLLLPPMHRAVERQSQDLPGVQRNSSVNWRRMGKIHSWWENRIQRFSSGDQRRPRFDWHCNRDPEVPYGDCEHSVKLMCS